MKLLHQSPLDPDFVQNPYALYSRVLQGDPVRFWDNYDMTAVFDHKTVQALLRDRRFGRAIPPSQQQAVAVHLADFDAVERYSMLDMEPPQHTRLRGLVLRAFTSRRIKSLEPDIRQICADLIAQFPATPFDLIPAYCTQVPVKIIARLLGVPEEMWPDLLRWSNAMVAMYQAGRTRDIEDAANTAAREFTAFLTGYIEARRSDPRDDLLTQLIAAEEHGEKLSTPEMIGTCILLLNAGHEATVHTLGNGIKALLEYDKRADVLVEDAVDATVEEILRFDPPLHMFTRYAYEDIKVGDHVICAGDQVALMLGSAGRDGAVYTEPNTFDPTRTPIQHAAFGGGLHFCVGAPLARMEMRIALQMLFEACPGLTLVDAPIYANTYHFHGLERLVVAQNG